MDPDMVRQQAEAEREALALRAKKPAGPAPASAVSIPRAVLTDAVQDAAPAVREQAPPLASPPSRAAEIVLMAPAPALPEAPAPEPQAGPVPRRAGSSAAAQFGRFISFGLAGAMLGGGLGILAVNYLQLSADAAKLAVYGPAALLAGACAIASFFTTTPHEYRQE